MTRQYNKSAHKHHYSQAVGPVKKRKGAAASVSADPELEAEGDNLNAADSDVDSDEEVINALKVVCLSVCHCVERQVNYQLLTFRLYWNRIGVNISTLHCRNYSILYSVYKYRGMTTICYAESQTTLSCCSN